MGPKYVHLGHFLSVTAPSRGSESEERKAVTVVQLQLRLELEEGRHTCSMFAPSTGTLAPFVTVALDSLWSGRVVAFTAKPTWARPSRRGGESSDPLQRDRPAFAPLVLAR